MGALEILFIMIIIIIVIVIIIIIVHSSDPPHTYKQTLIFVNLSNSPTTVLYTRRTHLALL